MIFKRLTSIALIAALSLPNALMAVKVDHYAAERDGDGFPLINMTPTTPPVIGEPVETQPPTANTFVSIPLGSSPSTSKAKTPDAIESQVVPSRKRFTCTSDTVIGVGNCVAFTLLGLMFLGLIGETIWILTRPPSDPCANQTTTLDTTTSDFTLIPETVGSSGRGRTVTSLHHYQKRRGGGVGRGGVSRICPSPTTRSSSTFTSTLLSNFYDLTSDSSSTSTGNQSTTSDTTPPPLVQQPQE